jgi:CO/xanthine dehydrogenase FAD-binding subunit
VDLNTVTEFAPATDAAWRDGDAWLGGGTWLFSVPQPRVSRLLDLQAFGWTPVDERPDGVLVGATCTFAQLASWQPERPGQAGAALLARQCCHALLGSFKVHNVATVGGNICLSLPAGPMTSLASALDGVALVRDQGSGRRVPVSTLVTGDGRNSLRPGSLLTHLHLPGYALTGRHAFRQLSLSPVGRSAVLVIARRDSAAAPPEVAGHSGDGTTVITVTASVPRPVQLRFPAPPSPAEALGRLDAAVLGDSGPGYLDDVHGSAAWRSAMTRRLVLEVLGELSG